MISQCIVSGIYYCQKAIRRDRLKSHILSYLTVKIQDPDLSRSFLKLLCEQGRGGGEGGVGGGGGVM